MADITGKRVAVLVDDYFEQAELTGPVRTLREAGALVDIIAPDDGEVHGMNHAVVADTFQTDRSIDDVKTDEYDALVLPGGAINADTLRMNIKARIWVKKFMDDNKPLAVICHAPWVLISAGVADGRKLTSYWTIQDDLRNAGAIWSDQEVVIDGNLITSRQPDDVPAFTQALIAQLE
ncbi:MAG: intracellular protease, PfpI family [Candidatus Saccharibacteria bacterium]|nr:intracellular protease, PfpI family [Candidatus Saccharibacteria bacterium]